MYKVGDKFIIKITDVCDGSTIPTCVVYKIGKSNIALNEKQLNEFQNFDEIFDDTVKNIEDAEKEGYSKGLNDVWECAKKIYALSFSETEEIYGEENADSLLKILRNFAPQEAIEKLKEWEENKEKFNVGDVIYSSLSNEKAIIKSIDSFSRWRCFNEHNNFLIEDVSKRDWKKTGEHIDLSNVFDILKS